MMKMFSNLKRYKYVVVVNAHKKWPPLMTTSSEKIGFNLIYNQDWQMDVVSYFYPLKFTGLRLHFCRTIEERHNYNLQSTIHLFICSILWYLPPNSQLMNANLIKFSKRIYTTVNQKLNVSAYTLFLWPMNTKKILL